MKYGLIGMPLAQSFSPQIHRLLAGYSYELCPLSPDKLQDFLKKRAFCGINVTIPYKETVIPALDEIDDTAKRIGAVNTVCNKEGRLIGYNTDYCGMRALLSRAGLSPAGKTVLILGTGGTSKTARTLMRDCGAASVLRVSRTPREPDCIGYREAERIPAQIIINTTPCGMFPHPEEQPLDLRHFGWLEGVIDAVYHPLRSRLVLQARELGARGQGGLSMLVAQAAAASELFLGQPLPEDALERVYRTLHGQAQNIVLIGMPSCGKTTVGTLLAQQLQRDFYDTDAEIVRDSGCEISELFAREGEAGFRARESRVIAALAQKTGVVIATGGGAVCREENMRALRQNGRIYLLDRPLTLLCPTEDRPLSRSKEALFALAHKRIPLYRAACDMQIENSGTPEQAGKAIMEDFRR